MEESHTENTICDYELKIAKLRLATREIISNRYVGMTLNIPKLTEEAKRLKFNRESRGRYCNCINCNPKTY